MATTPFDNVVLNLNESSYPSCLSDCTVIKESPLKENVVCIWQVSPVYPGVLLLGPAVCARARGPCLLSP